jgi:ethanolamine transporter
LFSVVIAILLGVIPKIMIVVFQWFGYFVVAFLTFFLVLAGFQETTGVTMLSGMAPLSDAFSTVGNIAVTLAGAFGLVYLIQRYLGKPLGKFGKLLGINESAATGMVATLANDIAMFNIEKDMDPRGKVINMAFCVSAAFVFGDHLGFVGGAGGGSAGMIAAVIVGKLVAGITAVVIAYFVAPKSEAAAAGKKA